MVKGIEADAVVKVITNSGKTMFLELLSAPSHARTLNGVSDDGEYMVKGYLLTKKLQPNLKQPSLKIFIVKESNIEFISDRREEV